MSKNPYLDLIEQGQSANATAGDNPYLTVVDNGFAQDQARFKASTSLALDANPDEVARQRRIAEALAIPPAAVEALPEDTARQARMGEIEKATADAPVVRRKFTDADFAKLAHDDVENLAGIERTVAGTLRDVGVTAIKGAVGLPNAAVGLVDILAGGRLGRGLDSIGVRFNDASKILDDWFSPAQQEANRKVQQAEGFLDTMSAAISNPSTIGVTVGESLPQMAAGGLIGRGILALAPKAAPLVAGAAGEGIIGAGSAASQMRADNADGLLSGKEQIGAVGLGAGTSLFSVVGGKLAQKMGVGDIDTALASGAITRAEIRKGLGRELAEAGISEGVFEELPQSAQEQVWQNWAQDKPLMEGVSNAAAMGLLAGAVTGAGFQGVQRITTRNMEKAEQADRDAGNIEKLNELARASKVLQRDPAAVEALVQEAAAEGSDKVYIDANALLQSGFAQQVTEVSPSVAAQLQEKAATGGMVEIPLGEYVAKIAASEFAPQLADHVKVNPDGFTRAEAREFYATQGEELKAQVEAQLEKAQVTDEFRASRDRVKETVLSELNSLGRFTADKNEFDATLIAARVAVRASQLGITPEAFFEQQKQRLQVQAESITGGESLSQPGGLVSIYHGTTPEAAEAIERAGFDLSRSADGSVWFTSNKDIGEVAATGKGAVVERILDERALKLGGWVEADKYSTDEMIRMGYDGLKLEDDGEITYQIFNPEKLGRIPTTFDQEANGTTPYTADTIEVDGKPRPVVNNKGQRIAQTEEGLRNFWRWFGDSKVVDAEGRPLVVYHGTTADFAEFDTESSNSGSMTGVPAGAHVMSSSPEAASSYAGMFYEQGWHDPASQAEWQELWDSGQFKEASAFMLEHYGTISTSFADGGNVMPVYTALQNPLIVDAAGATWKGIPQLGRKVTTNMLAEQAKLQGYDGLIVKNVRDQAEGTENAAPADTIFAFRPEQIKSAIGNSGTYDGSDPNVLYQSGAAHPFAGFTREQFLGNPKITSDANGATLQPRVLTTVEPTDAEPFAAGKGLVAKYSEDGAAVFDGDKVVASYNFGDTLVVDKKHRRQGIAEELVYQWRIRNPQAKPARERTRKSQALQEKVWDRIERELSAQGADTIEVDGKVRPATNSEGQRIHPTEEGLINFWRWFGDSKVVDGSGKPLVVKHGSRATFSEFRAARGGMYFSTEGADVTAIFTEDGRGDAGEYYLAIGSVFDARWAAMGDAQKEELRAAIFSVVDESDVEGAAEKLGVSVEDADPFEVFTDGEFFWGYGRDLQNSVLEAIRAKGYDGVIFPDALTLGEQHTSYVAFDPEQIKPATGGFDPTNPNILYQGGEAPRGAFTPSTTTMTLLKNANLSTFLHEAGHYFLEGDIALVSDLLAQGRELSEGEQAIASDVSALLKWFGIEGTIEDQLRQWHTMDFEERRAYHEQTAESFERYLFEGKAPSIELQPAFSRFRQWMISVYKSLKDLLRVRPDAGKLNDEVRAVFDRMLATEEEIALAEQGRSMMPIFRTEQEATNAGLTPDEFKRIQSLGEQATEDAVRDLQARALRDLQYSRNARNREIKKLQRESLARRREVRMGVRTEVMAQPVYRAWDFLTGRVQADDKVGPVKRRKTGKKLDPSIDSLFVAMAKMGGLSSVDVAESWGITDPIPRQGFGPIVHAGGHTIGSMGEKLAESGYLAVDRNGKWDNRDFEDAFSAELRGSTVYSNQLDPSVLGPDPMAGEGINPAEVRAGRLNEASLEDMGIPAEIIEHLRNLRMVVKVGGWHPDLIAQKFGYASGDEMVRTVAAAENPRIVVEGLTDARMLEQYGELATPEAIEREADKAIHNEVRARMVATEANALARATGKPKILVEAAKSYASTMVARLRIGDLRRSAVAYANAETRAAKAAAKAIKSGDLATAAAEKRNQTINVYAVKVANDAVAEVDKLLRTWGEFARRADDKLVKTYDMDIVNAVRVILGQYGIAPAKSKKASEYIEVFKTNDPEMYAVVSEAVAAAEANAKPFKDLTVEQVRGLKDEIDTLLHIAKRSRQLELGGDLIDRQEVEDQLYARLEEIGIPDTIPGEVSAVTPAEKRMAQFKGLLAFATRVESWAKNLDGKAWGGPFTTYVYGTIKRAANAYRTDKAARLAEFRALVDSIAPTLKRQIIAAPELGYTFGKDSGGSAINEILHAILHTGNESNKRKLLLGRGWATETSDGMLETGRWDGFIARMVAEGKITQAHFDFAQGVWDMLESTKPLAQKTHRDVFGKYFDEVTANEFVDPFGITRRGGYVPAMVDSRVAQDADLRKMQDAENASMAYAFPTTPKGFTKARVEYNRPLMLDLRTLAQHIDKVLLFSHMEMPVRDVQRLLSKKVGSGLARVAPGAVNGLLTPWLRRSALQQVETPIAGDHGWMRVFSVLRARAGMAAMFGNLANAVQQVTGFSMAAVMVKPRLLKSAMVDYMKGPKELAASVSEASEYMRIRMVNEVAVMTDAINDILLNPSLLERGEAWTKKHAYFLQSAFDNTMSPVIWTAAYNQASEAGSDHDTAVQFADGVIRQTQGSTLAEDISRIEGGNAFVRMFTQFAGYFNMQANLLGSEFVTLMREQGLRKGYGRGIYVFTMGFLIQAVVGELIMQLFRGGPDDEDDDGYTDDWLAALFLWAPLRNATAMAPGVGQGVNSVVNAWNSKPYDDRLASSPAVSMLESAAKAPVSVYKAVAEDGSPQRAVRDVGTLISMSVGLPGNLAARPIGYLAGVAAGDIEPTGPVDAVRGTVTGTASPASK